MRALALVPALAALALLAGCGDDDTGPSTSTPATPDGGVTAAAVSIKGFAFNPAGTTVKVGQKVTWTNDDSAAHNVVAEGDAFASDSLSQGDTFEYTPDTAGVYGYVCTFHSLMKGTLKVE